MPCGKRISSLLQKDLPHLKHREKAAERSRARAQPSTGWARDFIHEMCGSKGLQECGTDWLSFGLRRFLPGIRMCNFVLVGLSERW